MTQYDAGPGDWSDRPWEDPDKKAQQPQARRQRVKLPPWVLLAMLVGVIILLCVGLVLIVQAIRGGGEEEGTATPPPTNTVQVAPTDTRSLFTATPEVTPTNTVVLPIETPLSTAAPTEIGPGALVVVQGTAGAGLNLRTEPSTQAQVVTNAREGTVLTVLEGPQEAGNHTWWKLRAPDGKEGWGAADWLVLQTEQ
ncbi:MAG: SH3 domain-containing protein [Anaerolineae bacterium]